MSHCRFRVAALLAVSIVARAAAGDDPEPRPSGPRAVKLDQESMSGTFAVTVYERDGTKMAAADLKKMKVVQQGGDWAFSMDEDVTRGTDTIYPGKKPKQVDSRYLNGPARGLVVKGIYKIDGDTITYCWAELGRDRPTQFATKANSGLTLIVLKRVKK